MACSRYRLPVEVDAGPDGARVGHPSVDSRQSEQPPVERRQLVLVVEQVGAPQID